MEDLYQDRIQRWIPSFQPLYWSSGFSHTDLRDVDMNRMLALSRFFFNVLQSVHWAPSSRMSSGGKESP